MEGTQSTGDWPATLRGGRIKNLSRGTIARITDRGFGFIAQERGEDLFFHSSALQDVAFDSLRRGDEVEFDSEPDPRGRGNRAVNVRKVQN